MRKNIPMWLFVTCLLMAFAVGYFLKSSSKPAKCEKDENPTCEKTVDKQGAVIKRLLVLMASSQNAGSPSVSSQDAGVPRKDEDETQEDEDDDKPLSGKAKQFVDLFLSEMGTLSAVAEQSFCGRVPRCTSEACQANFKKFQEEEQGDSDVQFYNRLLSGVHKVAGKLMSDDDKGLEEDSKSLFGDCAPECRDCGTAGRNPCSFSCAFCKKQDGDVEILSAGRKVSCPAPCKFCGGNPDKPACPLYCLPCSSLMDNLTSKDEE